MAPDDALFDELLAATMAGRQRFGHREHVQLTWRTIRRVGTADAIEVISTGIRRTPATPARRRSTTPPSAVPGWS
jgi:hypothetical protein